jgi:hypothetical protein
MCSSECPCNTNEANKWVQLGETKLNTYERTLVQASGTGSNKDALKDANGRYRFITTASTTANVFEKFSECHKYLQAKYDDNTSANSRLLQAASASVSTGNVESTENNSDIPKGKAIDTGIKILKYFEQKYECSGVCEPALFYYSLNLNKGIPSTTCLSYMKEEVGDGLKYLGITGIVTGITMFLIWIFQYALWRKYDDEEGFD